MAVARVLHLLVVEPAHMLREQDSLAYLELSYTRNLKNTDGEALVEVGQVVFLRVDVEAAMLHLDTVAGWAVYTQQRAAGSSLLWWW